MAKGKVYPVYVTVEGTGVFPFDMLRYDDCKPASAEDTKAIGPKDSREAHVLGRRRVTLVYNATTKRVANHPDLVTVGRWSSFRWMVVNIDRSSAK